MTNCKIYQQKSFTSTCLTTLCCGWAFLIFSGIVWDNHQQKMIKNMPTLFEMNVSWCATISTKIFGLFVGLPQTHGPYHGGTRIT